MAELSDRQKEIIAVSIGIIAKNGIQQLTIKNISKEIKISEPAIYRHFESKMDILIAILSQFKDNSKIISSKIILSKATSLEQIEAIYKHNFKKFSETPALTAVIFSEEIFQNDEKLSDMVSTIMQHNQKMISKIITVGQKKGEIRDDISEKQIGIIIMGALRLLVTRWRLSKYSFNLQKEGTATFNSIKTVIKK